MIYLVNYIHFYINLYSSDRLKIYLSVQKRTSNFGCKFFKTSRSNLLIAYILEELFNIVIVNVADSEGGVLAF